MTAGAGGGNDAGVDRCDSPPRVLLVEDDASVREAVAASLRREGYEVRTLADAGDVVPVAGSFRPDIAVLDVRLPYGSEGFEVARGLRGAGELPIIFLTAADALEDRLTAFSLGADDYLVKPFSTAELLARVAAVLRRSNRAVSATVRIRDLAIDLDARTAVRGGQVLNLTTTEFRLLATLARAPGTVFSKIRLLSEVWDFDAYDPNLVEVHISALRRKLEAHGPRMIFTERGRGYTIRP